MSRSMSRSGEERRRRRPVCPERIRRSSSTALFKFFRDNSQRAAKAAASRPSIIVRISIPHPSFPYFNSLLKKPKNPAVLNTAVYKRPIPQHPARNSGV